MNSKIKTACEFSATSFANRYITVPKQSQEQLNLPDTTKPAKSLTLKRIEHKYGATKSSIHWHLINIFHLSPKFVETTDNYFLLHYTGKKFASRMQDGIITVTDEDNSKQYQVQYDECTPAVAKKAHLLYASFRSAKSEIGIPYNYVIIRVIEESRLES